MSTEPRGQNSEIGIKNSNSIVQNQNYENTALGTEFLKRNSNQKLKLRIRNQVPERQKQTLRTLTLELRSQSSNPELQNIRMGS